jgi:hypothetical protein
MPRPAGRSGWLSTATMGNPAWWIAARAIWANSGVPANATRSVVVIDLGNG